MKITNKAGLPDPIVRAVENDPYDKGDAFLSTTELIAPVQQAYLKRHHRDEIVEDASDRLWSLIGQIGHNILERAAIKGHQEFRVSCTVLGRKVSGQVDLVDRSMVDYKFTSHWSVKDGVKPEWEAQLNVNRWLVHHTDDPRYQDIHVEDASIVAIFRDWSLAESRRNREYPQSQVAVLPVRLWPLEETGRYIRERVQAHINAEETGHPPPCTDAERWTKPTIYAAMKKGRKSALPNGLCSSHEDALKVKGMTHVEVRPGEHTRCKYYCPVSEFCSQWKENQERKAA